VTANRISSERRAFDILPDGRFVGVVSDEPEGEATQSRFALTTGAPGAEMRVVLNWFEELKARVPVR
jgi:hypothetical protein